MKNYVISFVVPSRNNLKYLEWSYNSIRKNLKTEHYICLADDFSNDGTWEWIQEQIKIDPYLKAIKNEGPERCGHTVLYDRIVNELVETDIFVIHHSDMYAFPGLDTAILKYIKPGTVVSATRIEPELHPRGKEKITQNWGTEPEQFDDAAACDWVNDFKEHYKGKYTYGIFAPWAIYKSDFLDIGGHDPLYSPQSREDWDLFNRFVLAGYKLIQTWEGFIYHLTCKGSRFNPLLTTVGKESDEWLEQNKKSERNFIRKWGSMVSHNEFMFPTILPKYNIAFKIKNILTFEMLKFLEPYCDKLYLEMNARQVINEYNTLDYIKNSYIKLEQPNTKFDLDLKIKIISDEESNFPEDVIISFNMTEMAGNQQAFYILTHIPQILQDSGSVGVFKLDNFTFLIKKLDQLQQNVKKYKDSSEMLAKKIQDYAIFFKDLKYVNSTLYAQNNILKAKFRILLDSVVVLNQAAQVDTNDNMIVVRFEGYQGKINYKGKVVYFKLTNKGSLDSLLMQHDPINIYSNIYVDGGIIKNKIYADGELIDNANTVVDSTVYNAMGNILFAIETKEPGFFDYLKIFGELDKLFVFSGDNKSYKSSISLGLKYELPSGFYLSAKRDFINEVYVGNLGYSISISKLWNITF